MPVTQLINMMLDGPIAITQNELVWLDLYCGLRLTVGGVEMKIITHRNIGPDVIVGLTPNDKSLSWTL